MNCVIISLFSSGFPLDQRCTHISVSWSVPWFFPLTLGNMIIFVSCRLWSIWESAGSNPIGQRRYRTPSRRLQYARCATHQYIPSRKVEKQFKARFLGFFIDNLPAFTYPIIGFITIALASLGTYRYTTWGKTIRQVENFNSPLCFGAPWALRLGSGQRPIIN